PSRSSTPGRGCSRWKERSTATRCGPGSAGSKTPNSGSSTVASTGSTSTRSTGEGGHVGPSLLEQQVSLPQGEVQALAELDLRRLEIGEGLLDQCLAGLRRSRGDGAAVLRDRALEQRDRGRMQLSGAEHFDGVHGFAAGESEQHVDRLARAAAVALLERQGGAVALDGDRGIERRVEHAQESADVEDVLLRQRQCKTFRSAERLRSVVRHRLLESGGAVVVEERFGVGRLDQRRYVEGAEAEAVERAVAVAVPIGAGGRAEAAVVRMGLGRLAGIGG